MAEPEKTIKFVVASAEDAEALADLRVDFMRPSLEALGRFDPERARERFLASFDPDTTQKIDMGGELIGFYAVKEFDDHLYLDNLYLRGAEQGRGVGSMIIGMIKEQASKRSLPIRLIALIGSDANGFYIRHGFKLIEVNEFDNHYEFISN